MTDSRFQASEKNQEIWGKALKGGRDTVIILVTGQRDVLHETEGLLWQGRPQKQNMRQPYTAGCQGMTGTCRKVPASRHRRDAGAVRERERDQRNALFY